MVHGKEDKSVPVNYSRKILKIFKKAKIFSNDDSISGMNSAFICGTPKKRLSLANILAKYRTVKVQIPNWFP